MFIKRRTRVVVETHQVWAISRRGIATQSWCPDCAGEVRMITPEEAAAILRLTPRTIYSWVEAAKIHFTEQPEGHLLICLDSLPAS
ncbi:MAG TPA: helix-turn-helix domain-containing protein [Pyrinomonadaceae bacterium]|nr:helix-turn-helix domain-containing protein [Pyrinomonadaceae bacterium]